MRAVFQAAAERGDRERSKRSPGHGFGIAGGVDKGGHISTCVEVDPTSKKVRLRHIVEAWESGAIVNPDGPRN